VSQSASGGRKDSRNTIGRFRRLRHEGGQTVKSGRLKGTVDCTKCRTQEYRGEMFGNEDVKRLVECTSRALENENRYIESCFKERHWKSAEGDQASAIT